MIFRTLIVIASFIMILGLASQIPSAARSFSDLAPDDSPVADIGTVVSFTVRDFQPAINHTGPMNWIARNPRDVNEVFASSITGGLWRSVDAGNFWTPMRTLQPWSVSAVAYLFDDTPGGAILVTTREDFRVDSGAGVWRSNDHGDSWTQLAQVPTGCSDVPRAHGIAVRGTEVAVATSCGVLLSANGRTFGKFPATAFFPSGVVSGPISEHFYSVEFTPSGSLLLGGEAGFFFQMRAASAPLGLAMTGNNGEMRRAFAISPSPGHSNFVLALSGGGG